MKRFWLVMLSLGIVLAFSAQAFAVDVKFSGDFYVAGMYVDKTTLNSTDWQSIVKEKEVDHAVGPSTGFFYQRLRLETDFVVSPGLTLITRFDAMERIWGGKRATVATPAAAAADSAQTGYENENIAFDWAYINYVSPIGIFDVGYMEDGRTGTVFGDNYVPAGRIKYAYTSGPATIKAAYTKLVDRSLSTTNNAQTYTDVDYEKWAIEGVYAWKDGKAGMQITYYRDAQNRPPVGNTVSPGNYLKRYLQFTPYAIAKIGPVTLQAELIYATGRANDYDGAADDVSLDNIAGWVDATADFNQFYFGGTIAYVSGDDPDTRHQEGGTLNGGRDWNPCLIMFNYYDRGYSMGPLNGYNGTTDAGVMTNAWFGQGRIGVRPTPKLDIMASVSFAAADQKPIIVYERDYGWEADVTATFKITNNLSYMLGAGYLWTGDYYKGLDGSNKVNDNYMLINKLTLTF